MQSHFSVRVPRFLLVGLGASWLCFQPAHAMNLRDAVSLALISNPQIGQAIQDREALEFELKQAHGEYLPRVDFEGSSAFKNTIARIQVHLTFSGRRCRICSSPMKRIGGNAENLRRLRHDCRH